MLEKYPKGIDKVLELVGPTTLKDSLACVRAPGGLVCQTRIVSRPWNIDGFKPMEFIPTSARLTVYAGGPAEFLRMPLADLVKDVEAGKLKVKVGMTFKLEDMVEAHRVMDANKAGGKIVVLS